MPVRADMLDEQAAGGIAPPPSTLVELLRLRAAQHPDRPLYTFLYDGEREESRLNYGELDRRARAIAALLQRMGVRGERALLLYPAGLDFIAAFFGCLYAGVIPVPTYPPHRAQTQRLPPRLRALLHDAQPSFALTDAAMLANPDGVRARVAELRQVQWIATDAVNEVTADEWRDPCVSGEDLAFLQYTSGSTSEPKGVMVSHRNLLDNQRLIKSAFRQDTDSVVVGWLPLYHDMGLIGNVLQPLYAGARCVLMSPTAFLQSPFRWLEAVSRYRATTSGGPNFAYELCARKVTPEQRATLDLSGWKVAFNGAEPVRHDTLERFAETFAVCGFRPEAFFPCYGLAEATLFVSGGAGRSLTRTVRASALAQGQATEAAPDDEAAPARADTRTLITCGQPPSGQRVRIVNPKSLDECEPDQVGEIWTAGESVAHGYWNRPDETRETFRAFLPDTGDLPYLRTGDLGFLHAGELYVTGRLKELIIVRGRNHYPHDIERTAEQSQRAFRPGGTAAFSFERDGEERLVILQELDPRQRRPEVESLVASMRRAVAEQHELSVYDILLLKAGSLPKTSSGKLQRLACRDDYLAGRLTPLARDTLPERSADTVADEATINRESLRATPAHERQTLLETFLLARLARALAVSPARLDREKALTAQGLDSLSALELKGAIEELTGVRVPLTTLLDGANAADLAAYVLAALAEPQPPREPDATPSAAAATAAYAADSYPLSRGQKALWLLHRLAPASAAYHIANAVRFRTSLDADALRHALQQLVERHPVLRTTFSAHAGEPVQHVHERAGVSFEIEDASGLSDEALQSQLADEAARPFDLERGPLFRARLYTRSAEDRTLLLVVHHIIADFWSVGLLVRELEACYSAAVDGATANLEPPHARFADYVATQESLLAGREGERLWDFWKEQLAGDLPALELPADRPRPPAQTFDGAAHSFALDAELTRSLKALANAEGVTLYTLLLTAFQVLLFRYTGQPDILVGSPASGRSRAEFDEVVGYFVNPLVLRSHADARVPFQTFLAAAHRTVLAALDHQDFPFPLLVERLQPARDPSRSPIFQAMFVLQKATHPELRSLNALALREAGLRVDVGALAFETVTFEHRAAQFDLTLMMAEESGTLRGWFEYARDLFDRETVRRLSVHFETLLRAVVAAPQLPLAALPLIGEDERRRLVAWNDTRVVYERAGNCLHELFERQTTQSPEAVAVCDEGGQLSYAELNARANRLAHYLRRRGVSAESRVGVLLERSTGMVVALLGILKTGAAYVPLDPDYPAERLRFMLEDCGASVLLTERKLAPALPPHSAEVLCLDACAAEVERESASNPTATVSPDNLAYVIYTSGSTGKPKGAMLAHREVVNCVLWMQQAYGLDENDCFLFKTTLNFDPSVWEVFWPLATGARLFVARHGGQHDAAYLAEIIRERQITFAYFVPSMLSLFLDEPESPRAASLRKVICGGESLPSALVERFYATLHGAELHHSYGPTETAIAASETVCTRDARRPVMPIGRPLANTQMYVLDERMEPVPVGVAGALYVGGACVGRGYLNRPELTAERFIPNPFSAERGARLYVTGDLARYLPDGQLEFRGRADSQVKLRGMRVELGEIEAALREHPSLDEAVVVLCADAPGGVGLVAYLVSAASGDDGSTTSAEQLRAHLSVRLPRHMIPSAFVALAQIPLMPNGKVDHKSLPAPDVSGADSARDAEPPQTPVEESIARIWSDLLGVARIGRHHNFFDLGGHSLLVTQVAARVRSVFDVELPMTVFFQSPTIAGLAHAVAQGRAAQSGARGQLLPEGDDDGAASRNKIARREDDASAVPLSFAQQRLWFIDQLETGSPLYNIPAAVRLRGPLRIEILERALNEIVRRHESLRTVYADTGGSPVQRILPSLKLPLPVFELGHLPAAERDAETEKLYAQESLHRFDLSAGPLLRTTLLRYGAQDHVLLLTLHHIAADGWSLHLFFRELTTLCDAFSRSLPSPLPELPVQYADFALWQRSWLTRDLLESQLVYWREQLGGALAPLRLPFERARVGARSNRGASQAFALPPALGEELKALARQEDATLFMLLLAAFQMQLHRYTGREQILVGTDIAARRQAETETLIGFFANQLVLRADAGGNPTFREFLQRVKRSCLGAYAHQDVPFEKLVEDLQPRRDLSRHPLFQIKFVFWQSPLLPPQSPDLTLSPLEFERGAARFDLTLFVNDDGPQLTGSLEYDTDLFDAATAERVVAQLQSLLTSIVAAPETRILSLEMSTGQEKEQRKVKQTERQQARRELFKKVRPKEVSLSPDQLVTSDLKLGDSLPLVFEPKVNDLDLADWARGNLASIESALLRHGVVLFRGFPVNSVAPFEQFAATVCPGLFNENGEHPRKSVSGNVYTPVFYPPDRQLLWHNENSFNHRWPLRILFCCLRPAEHGGETPLVDSRKVYAGVPTEIREEFASKGIMYVRNYGGGLGLDWQTVFATSDRAEVEARCRVAQMNWEWKEGDRLKTTCVRPAVVAHPRSGEMSWFNQAQHWHVSCLDAVTRAPIEAEFHETDYPRHCYFGDGSPIADDVMGEILKVYAALEVVFPPQRGDILLLDNVLTAHARKSFSGAREVLVAMGEMSSFADARRAS
jgi:amino acid adenylation domain-containing protein